MAFCVAWIASIGLVFTKGLRMFAAAALAVSLDVAVPGVAHSDTTTTLTFVAHQDDDLLFMNPDIASDVQAGYNVWVVYETAGEVPWGDMEYANQRIEGERAAYARAARVPNNWTYEPIHLNGHELATNRLDGTNVHLVFTFMHAAGDVDACGDLFRMWHDASYVAYPIDGRAPYTKDSFVGTLRSLIVALNPDYIRSQSSIGHREYRADPSLGSDHIDHTSAAILAAEADTDDQGNTLIRRDEYTGYAVQDYPDNVSGYWRDEKTAIWHEYRPHDWRVDQEIGWDNVMGKQYRPEGRIFWPGTAWVPPGDFNRC